MQDLRTEINQCNIEWRQAFGEQQMQIDKLKEKIQVQDKIMSRDIQYIIGLLLNQMVTIIEDEVLGEKRQITVGMHQFQFQSIPIPILGLELVGIGIGIGWNWSELVGIGQN